MTNIIKYLINCQDGENNLEHATVKFILATTASKTHETAMFITSDATDMLVKGKADGLVSEGLEPIADLMAQYLGNGGKIWVCPVCVLNKGLEP
ncbi:MAG: DsrE family protein, partial [Marinicella sp.]